MPRIFDAVYGYIELDEVEFALVNSPIFQRLHWIKQLGPLHIIFPSAQHSRFSHSIGVFHIVSKMIEHLKNRGDKYAYKFDNPEDERILKFAALLHDIGHVPLSHVGEQVLEKTYSASIEGNEIDIFNGGGIGARWTWLFDKKFRGADTKLHEALSAEIVCCDPKIDDILKKYGGNDWADDGYREKVKQRIGKIIVGELEDPNNHISRGLLHSELDADRLDYLLRDSFFTGVGYGHIDLDYIISRLVVTKNEGIRRLCVEKKGLHTVEHYILGRFFLQTQVIFNRKVRLLDLLFADVMEFLMKCSEDGWRLMDLKTFLDNIRKNKSGNDRSHGHRVYEYTDAQVFDKMRKFHDKVSEKLGDIDSEDERELKYIDDCIKIIMDGKVSDPVMSAQKIVDLAKYPKIKQETEDKGKLIAKGIASKLEIEEKRIRVNAVKQRIMKYTAGDEGEGDEEANREAVRIVLEKEDGNREIPYAARSNASVLSGLVDKALLVFNVYYVEDKKNPPQEVKDIRKSIKEGFDEFKDEHFRVNPKDCGCETGDHLCQIIRGKDGLDIAKKLAQKAAFICRKCGMVSSGSGKLCQAVDL